MGELAQKKELPIWPPMVETEFEHMVKFSDIPVLLSTEKASTQEFPILCTGVASHDGLAPYVVLTQQQDLFWVKFTEIKRFTAQ